MALICKEVARIVNPEDYQTFSWEDWSAIPPGAGDSVLKSFRHEFRVPEVITLTKYDRLPRRKVAFSRRNIYKRDHWLCQYCGCSPGGGELTIDHVLPRAQGGTSSWTNCVLACIDCNKRKADRTPKQCGMKLKKEPVAPEWKPLYADSRVRLDSWSKFISEAYWQVPLRE